METRRQIGEFLAVTAPHVTRLVKKEGLPAYPVNIGGRMHLRFRMSEVQAWLEGRRERQIAATIDGRRYTRRRIAPLEGPGER